MVSSGGGAESSAAAGEAARTKGRRRASIANAWAICSRRRINSRRLHSPTAASRSTTARHTSPSAAAILEERVVAAGSRGGSLTLRAVGAAGVATEFAAGGATTGRVSSAIASISRGWTLLVRVFWIQYAAPYSRQAIVRISSPV